MINGRGINIGYRIYMDVLTGEKYANMDLIFGQFVYTIGEEGSDN